MCVDYKALNKLMIKKGYQIPLIEDIFDKLGGARVFSKFDLNYSYHQIRLEKGDRYKTAFSTHYCHFEFLVMPFRLSNASTTFQNPMTYLGISCKILYLSSSMTSSSIVRMEKNT